MIEQEKQAPEQKRKYVKRYVPADELKVGRPSPFDSLSIEQVKKLISKGFNDSEIADFLGVHPVTYFGWKRKHKDFFREIADYKNQANLKIERSLYDRAMGYEHEAVKFFVIKGKVKEVKYIERYPPDTEALKLWLINRTDDWKDKKDLNHSGEVTIKDLVSDVEDRQRKTPRLALN